MPMLKRVTAAVSAALCIITGFSINAQNPDTVGAVAQQSVRVEETTYGDFISQHENAARPVVEIPLEADDILHDKSVEYKIDIDGSCFLEGENSQVTYGFSVGKEGVYRLKLSYMQKNEAEITDPRANILIDGSLPFSSAKSVRLPRLWSLEGEKQYDSRGNELHRDWIQAPQWRETFIYDCEGRYNEPLYFYLTEGEHTVTLDFEYSKIAVKNVAFCNYKAPEKYSAEGKSPAKADSVFIEAEDFSRVSDSSVSVNIDKTNPDVTPNDAKIMQYNTVGGESFAKSGQTLYWEMSVEKSGWYYVAFKARQNIKKGFFSTRRFRIDGVLPYAECEDIRFTYSDGWQQFVLSDSKGEPMLFYFDEGRPHELSLECIPGRLSSAMTSLDGCIQTLNHIFLSVRMVVGNSADKYRDYYLEEDIPGLEAEVNGVLRQLEAQKSAVQSAGGTKGGDLSALQTVITQLKMFSENIDSMALKLDSFKSNISSLSAWVSELKSQPLEIDSIKVSGDLENFKKGESGFFSKLLFNIKRLLCSFSKSYGIVGDYNSEKQLTVWVSTGQDQLDIIRNLIDKEYKRDYTVQLQLVPTGLLEAAMAGKGPDVAMFIAGDMPVNLASRGGLVDLSELDDFESIMERFMPNAVLPYTYNGGCYALPLMQGFNMLFVRTDIFAELGLKVPDTWDDFFEILPVLQRNNLEAGIPSDLSTFATLVLQNGGTYYNEDLTATAFDEYPEASAFKSWTNLFTEKGLPLAYDFSNRFRTGEMPIGIADYSAYALLETSAPEISGRWEMYPVMATKNEDGELNRSVSSATTGTVGLQQGNTCAVIMKDCREIPAAWEFINWFTSTEIQVAYGLELEKRMGVAARYTTANKEALAGLPWSEKEQELLYEQWNNLVLLPEIPGSYYVTRNLNNAFRKVVYNEENPIHTLNRYNEIINREIERKRKGLKDNG